MSIEKLESKKLNRLKLTLNIKKLEEESMDCDMFNRGFFLLDFKGL